MAYALARTGRAQRRPAGSGDGSGSAGNRTGVLSPQASRLAFLYPSHCLVGRRARITPAHRHSTWVGCYACALVSSSASNCITSRLASSMRDKACSTRRHRRLHAPARPDARCRAWRRAGAQSPYSADGRQKLLAAPTLVPLAQPALMMVGQVMGVLVADPRQALYTSSLEHHMVQPRHLQKADVRHRANRAGHFASTPARYECWRHCRGPQPDNVAPPQPRPAPRRCSDGCRAGCWTPGWRFRQWPGGALGQFAHFISHHGKATPGLTARAASMAAFRANRLVWSAISLIICTKPTILPVLPFSA